MAGELSKLNFTAAARAVALQTRIMMVLVDSFVEDPQGTLEMAEQISQAADSGQLDATIAGAVFPLVTQVMQGAQQGMNTPPQGGS
jgi:hypothetical protein